MASVSPWPEDSGPALHEIRRHLNFPEIDVDTVDDYGLELVGAAASALVERYSPGAPQSLRDLAVIRTCQFLLGRSGAAVSKTDESLGDWSGGREFQASMVSALRASGAMSMLSRFKIRRARKVEVAE